MPIALAARTGRSGTLPRMATGWGTESDEIPAPGRVRRILTWAVVPLVCLLAFYFMVIPAWVWGSAGVSGLFGIRAEADIAGGLFWSALAVLPTGVAILMWFLTRSSPLRRERFALAVLVASVVGILTFMPILASPL